MPTLDPNVWTDEERALLREQLARTRWTHRDGREVTPADLEALARAVEASGPPPRPAPASLDAAEQMGRAAAREVDTLVLCALVQET